GFTRPAAASAPAAGAFRRCPAAGPDDGRGGPQRQLPLIAHHRQGLQHGQMATGAVDAHQMRRAPTLSVPPALTQRWGNCYPATMAQQPTRVTAESWPTGQAPASHTAEGAAFTRCNEQPDWLAFDWARIRLSSHPTGLAFEVA